MVVLLGNSLEGYADDAPGTITNGKWVWNGVSLDLTTEKVTTGGIGDFPEGIGNASYYGGSGLLNTGGQYTYKNNSKYLASGDNFSKDTQVSSWKNIDATKSSNWDKVVFFYHPATGMWLTQGGTFGTRTTLSADYGMKCLVSFFSKNPGKGSDRSFFGICTSAASSDGQMLCEKDYSSTTSKYYDESGTYVDDYGDNKSNPYCDANGTSGHMKSWSFIPFTNYSNGQVVTDASAQAACNEFGIRARYGSTADNNHADWELRYITYDPQTKEVYIKRYASDAAAAADPNTHWRMVTLNQILTALNTNPSKVNNPFNVSFWLSDPQLARCNSENSSWHYYNGSAKYDKDAEKDGGLKFGLDNCYSSKPDGTTADSRYGVGTSGLSDKNKEALMKENGKYFCGEVRKYSGSRVYQTWTCVKSGWYRVSCQGFAQNGDSRLYARVYTKNNSESNDQTKDFQSTNLRQIYDYDEAAAANLDTTQVTDMLSASKTFVDKAYPNHLYIYCEEGQAMEFGLRCYGANEWTCFDDFQLEYCGSEKVGLVLDEDKTQLDYISDAMNQQNGFKNTILHLHHNFDENCWSTIVLPVELTKAQVEELFGVGTKVAKMVNYNGDKQGNGSIQFKRTENESTGANTLIMKANTPYIIKPTNVSPKGGVNLDKTVGNLIPATFQYSKDSNNPNDLATPTCAAPYATTRYTKAVANDYITGTKFGENEMQMDKAKIMWNGLAFHGTLIKTYDEDETDTEKKYHLTLSDKYFVYKSKIYHIPSTRKYGLKGLRGYFAFEEAQQTQQTPAKVIKFSIDGVEEDADNVTGIDGLFEGGIANTQDYDGKVYDINGRVVSTSGSTAGLTKGIYIVKGKKVVVK